MRILHVGVFSDPASTNIQMALAIKKKKNNVLCFDYRYKKKKKEFNHFHKIFLEKISKIKLPFFEKIIDFHRYYLLGNWKVNRQLYSEVKKNKYDVVFFSKTDIINYNKISQLKKYTRTWYYFMDPLRNAINIKAQKYALSSTWSSATFSSVSALFRREGANSYHITEGYNPNIFNPGERNIKKSVDIIFVGSSSSKRKNYINYLTKNKINIECFGPGWRNKSIFIDDLAVVYRRTKIILNFTRDKVGFSDRVFHALGSRTLLISEYCRDLEKFFKKGFHLEWFKTPEELLKLVKFYLKNENLREKIAIQGYNYVLKYFTWEKIIEKIFNIIQNKKDN